MVIKQSKMRNMTAYQVSQLIKADYRAIKSIIEEFEQSEIVACVGFSDKSHNAKIYGIDDDTLRRIESLMQAKRKKVASVASEEIARDLQQIKDLQNQVMQQADVITNLKELVALKDKDISAKQEELHALELSKVTLDGELKQAQSRLLFIEDKSKTIEGDNARLQQDLSKLENTLKRRNAFIIALCAILLSIIVAAVCLNMPA